MRIRSSLGRRLRGLTGAPAERRVEPQATVPQALLELARRGPSPLVAVRANPTGPLSVAAVIPSFRRGSGGHATIAHLLGELRARGHSVSLWLEDSDARHAAESQAVTQRSFAEFFGAGDLTLHSSFEDWQGADVVLATGWQTVARALLLPGAGARAYLVQDHEPDFYGASAEALWAQQSYRQGLHCIAASRWLAEELRARYGASASHFDLGVDHRVYRPSDERRAEEEVVFYARAATPRRAVPLGLLALEELRRRRPTVQIALYGESVRSTAAFEHRDLGVLEDRRLAALFAQATVGMVLSLTNPSLTGLEMMASGLPCVELASDAMLATFGRAGPLQLADAEPLALCSAIEALLDDARRRAEISRAGIALMAERTWSRAADGLEHGLRAALQGRSQHHG